MRWPWENDRQKDVDYAFEDTQIQGENDDQYVLLQKINKVYGKKFHAVHNFSLCIKKKEFVVFVGPSGCGKSTTLRMIAGLEDISSGNLYIDGEYANNLLAKDRDIAMVFQNYALYPNMTVFGNMAFALKVRKSNFPVCTIKDENKYNEEIKIIKKEYKEEREKDISSLKANGANKEEIRDYQYLSNLSERLAIIYARKKYEVQEMTYNHKKVNELKLLLEHEQDSAKKDEINKKISEVMSTLDTPVIKYRRYKKDEIIEKVCNAARILEILDQLKKKPKELSGGQRQRVALGRAIVRNAKIFLMDEPLSNLDAKLRVQMRSEITELHKKINATTIYVTHDQTEAMTMADRIVVMKDGYIQQIGTPMEIYQHPRNLFVASFIGSPAMNIINGIYKKGVITFRNGQSITLSKELVKKHDDFYAQMYANKTREHSEFIDQLNKEKTEFLARNHSKKDEEEFNNKYEELLQKENELISRLESIIQQNPHKIIFGIRPENIVESSDKDSLEVSVRLSELLGDQYYIHFDFGGKDVLSKVSAEKLIDSGTIMKLKITENKIHLFDDESSLAII